MNFADSAKIIQTDFQASERIVLLSEKDNGIGSPFRFASSSVTNQLFWTDIKNQSIWFSGLDGSDPIQINVVDASNLVGIDVYTKKIPTSIDRNNEIPGKVKLSQNYPNPFNPTTTIGFSLPNSGKVSLEVFDLLGRKVATLLSGDLRSSGSHIVNFDASNLASGMYIYRLKTGNSVLIKKLTLIK